MPPPSPCTISPDLQHRPRFCRIAAAFTCRWLARRSPPSDTPPRCLCLARARKRLPHPDMVAWRRDEMDSVHNPRFTSAVLNLSPSRRRCRWGWHMNEGADVFVCRFSILLRDMGSEALHKPLHDGRLRAGGAALSGLHVSCRPPPPFRAFPECLGPLLQARHASMDYREAYRQRYRAAQISDVNRVLHFSVADERGRVSSYTVPWSVWGGEAAGDSDGNAAIAEEEQGMPDEDFRVSFDGWIVRDTF